MPLFWVLLSWVSRFIYWYAECRYAEYCYAECRVLFVIMLSAFMLSAFMLSAMMLSAIMLSAIMLTVVMLSVVMVSVVAPTEHFDKCKQWKSTLCLDLIKVYRGHLWKGKQNKTFEERERAMFFGIKRVQDQGPEQRESKLTVLCPLIIIILIRKSSFLV